MTLDDRRRIYNLLIFLAERMVHVYGESENISFVVAARELAERVRGRLKP